MWIDQQDAFVVFEHRPTDGGLSALLAPGFRHCFCLLRRPSGWLLCDPLKGGIVLEMLDGFAAADLLEHYLRQGRTVLVGTALPPPRPSQLPRPLTCVEIVKRAIGRTVPRVFTPRQLCRFLCAPTDAGPTFLRFDPKRSC